MNETKKLSGPAKDRFFRRFFVEAGGLDDATAERLTVRSAKIFSSVRVRKNAEDLLTDHADEAASRAPSGRMGFPLLDVPEIARSSSAGQVREPRKEVPPKEPSVAAAETSAIDPFVFGLVPVFKREGAEGLSRKLAGIDSVDHLRAMAKAQQIVLAREQRTGDIDITSLRAAVLEAVAKRVADRRAV